MESKMIEARALKKYIRSSPRKMRLVIDMIRGKNAAEAINILRFATKHAARDAEKTLRSAVANLSNIDESYANINFSDVVVKGVFVNCGPTMKRIQPAPMGRAYRVRKRSNHLTIVVATEEQN
jgi:large subunit ribosomal protein L22